MSYQKPCRCLVKQSHNRIPELLLAGRISLDETSKRSLGRGDVKVGVVCVLLAGERVAIVLQQ